jgi:FdhD protein
MDTLPASEPAERNGTQAIEVRRHRHGGAEICSDTVAEECPVALVFNGISHAVMMATPCDLEEFALGFALSEEIIKSPKEIHDLEVLFHEDSVEIQISIAQSAFAGLKQQRRTLAGRTGCGVCGIESIALLDLSAQQVHVSTPPLPVDQQLIAHILKQLPQHQPLMQATGCAHAAAWCDVDGTIIRAFEDIGRHNALDKLLGWMAKHEISSHNGLVFLTSRASYELVQKAARRNIAVLATISAPTSLAINIAHCAGIRLLSFCRENGYAEY